MDRLADLGVLKIMITGGEPLVHKDVFKIMKYIKDKNMDFALFTNGILLNKNNIKKIKKFNPDVIAISIDSIKHNIHDKIRGQNCFKKTIENIDLLLDEKIPVRINTTIFRGLNDKQKDIESLIEFFIKKGVREIVIGDFIDYGRGKKHKKYIPSVNEARKIVKAFKNKTKHVKYKNSLPALKFSDSFKDDKTKLSLNNSICGIGTFMLAIKENGDIILCTVLDDKKYNAGNILKKDIKDIWLNSKIFKQLRDHSLNDVVKCRKCSNKYECLGGCKARALMYNKKFNSPDLWMCSVYNSH